MAVPDELQQHARELTEATGLAVSFVEEGIQICVIVSKVTLPAGVYAVGTTDILFITDQQYPASAMDMFWTGGSVPANADNIENHAGGRWRRFSWHRNNIWNRDGNPLLDHFEFTQHRFAQDVRR